jgi:hypothetical protein
LLAASERVVAEKNSELNTERAAHRRDLQEALSVEVFFRTEESGLGGPTEERLAKLAALVEPMGGAVIRLDGYTDARGTETYNSTLSMARAEAVRDALIRGGMPAERVILTGAGETTSTAPEQDTDGMALERRVEMNVVDIDGAGRVAELGTNGATESPDWPSRRTRASGAPGRKRRSCICDGQGWRSAVNGSNLRRHSAVPGGRRYFR